MCWQEMIDTRLRTLSGLYEPSPAFSVMWPNVEWTADRFWDAQGHGDPAEIAATWHHLVMSVGNFKRQAQITILALGGGYPPSKIDRSRSASCTVPTLAGEMTLARDDLESWKQLTQDKSVVKGLQVATASTILSALWPRHHIIIDVRDLRAAIGLNLEDAVVAQGLDRSSRKNENVTWAWYEWMRPIVIDRAQQIGVEPLEIERALYVLDRDSYEGSSRKYHDWDQYAETLCSYLRHQP